jgi:putative transposase
MIEDLNVAGMVKNRHVARPTSDADMGEPSRHLSDKAKWHGVEDRVVDRFVPVSTTCSGCRDVRSDLDMSTRTCSYGARGLVIDRDVIAAINLPHWRLKEFSAEKLVDPVPAQLLYTA